MASACSPLIVPVVLDPILERFREQQRCTRGDMRGVPNHLADGSGVVLADLNRGVDQVGVAIRKE
jgi:hypothetical protein